MKRVMVIKARVLSPFGKGWHSSASPWFILAAALLLLCLCYTFLLTRGALNASTVQMEQWLLGRPITRADCVLLEWRNVGNALFILLGTILLGVVCMLLGYRWPVLPSLVALLFICLVCEGTGKVVLRQPIPQAVSASMPALGCPQIYTQPSSARLSAAAGMWWNIPPASQEVVERIHALSEQPLLSEWYYRARSYPGGHAMRGSFLGILVCWFCWRHIKRRAIRVPLMALALLVAFGVGFIQFYIGAHLITDTIAGYLLGIAAACCAIGLLLLNAPRQQRAAPS
ncbi:MAG TPA: phosphatase PAP2 family protein [Ktedonobacterales bacterium]